MSNQTCYKAVSFARWRAHSAADKADLAGASPDSSAVSSHNRALSARDRGALGRRGISRSFIVRRGEDLGEGARLVRPPPPRRAWALPGAFASAGGRLVRRTESTRSALTRPGWRRKAPQGSDARGPSRPLGDRSKSPVCSRAAIVDPLGFGGAERRGWRARGSFATGSQTRLGEALAGGLAPLAGLGLARLLRR